MNKQQLLSHSAASKAVTGQKSKMVLIISRGSREHQDMQVLCHRLGSHNSHWQLRFPILASSPGTLGSKTSPVSELRAVPPKDGENNKRPVVSSGVSQEVCGSLGN